MSFIPESTRRDLFDTEYNQPLFPENENYSDPLRSDHTHQDEETVHDCYSGPDCESQAGQAVHEFEDPVADVFVGPYREISHWDGKVHQHPTLGEYVVDDMSEVYYLASQASHTKLFCKDPKNVDKGYILVRKPGFFQSLFSANPVGNRRATYRQTRDKKIARAQRRYTHEVKKAKKRTRTTPSGSGFFDALAAMNFHGKNGDYELDLNKNGQLIVVRSENSSLNSVFMRSKTRLEKIARIAQAVETLAIQNEKKIRERDGENIDSKKIKENLDIARDALKGRINHYIKDRPSKSGGGYELGLAETPTNKKNVSVKEQRAIATSKKVDQHFKNAMKAVNNFQNPVYVKAAQAALSSIPSPKEALFGSLNAGKLLLNQLQREREALEYLPKTPQLQRDKDALDAILEAGNRGSHALHNAVNAILKDHARSNTKLKTEIEKLLKTDTDFKLKSLNSNASKSPEYGTRSIKAAIQGLKLAKLAEKRGSGIFSALALPSSQNYDVTTWGGYLKALGQEHGRKALKLGIGVADLAYTLGANPAALGAAAPWASVATIAAHVGIRYLVYFKL